MSYMEFLAQASICMQALDKALPMLQERYNLDHEDLSQEREIRALIRQKVMKRQSELREMPIGLSREADGSLIERLAADIPTIYENAIKKR